MTTVAIRPANQHDEQAVVACVQEAYRLYLERMDAPPAPLLDDYRALIARGVVHVAVHRGAVRGLIVAWPEVDHLYIDNIAVAPEFQGTGVGQKLLAFADELARRADRSEIRLYTNEVMTENVEYYPRRGFEQTHRGVDDGYRRIYFRRSVPT